MSHIEINALDWQKMKGLMPAIIQNAENGQVLMLGYMNREALIATLTSGQLTLYSRARKRLWRKGETSGNTMALQQISADGDNDSLLVHVIPKENACHKGFTSYYQPPLNSMMGYLDEVIKHIKEEANNSEENDYTNQLLDIGATRCAQKVGKKAVNTVIAAVNGDRAELMTESADLLYHLLILLKAAELNFYDVLNCLKEREQIAKHDQL